MKPMNLLGIEARHAFAQIIDTTVLTLMSQHETLSMTWDEQQTGFHGGHHVCIIIICGKQPIDITGSGKNFLGTFIHDHIGGCCRGLATRLLGTTG